MSALSHRFATALAVRINEALPPLLTARADGSGVNVYIHESLVGGSAAAAIIDDDGDEHDFAERAQTAARAVLSAIQDCVSEHLALPWPGDVDGQMAVPGVRADAHRLHLWYGSDELAPVVAFRPIELVGFGRPA